jgi:peptidoglycan/xylan/chitin deacetylase (PgdA/CDA1 family)
MKWMFKLDRGEIFDGLVSLYLAHNGQSTEPWLKKLYRSLRTKVGYSLDESIDFLLEIGERHGHCFTFFVVGKLAVSRPDLVKRIVEHGHEVASHSMSHYMPQRLPPKMFLAELVDSKRVLEELGAKVTGFRAPHLIMADNQYDILAEAGYAYSSSKSWRHTPLTLSTRNGEIVEAPVHYQDLEFLKHRDAHNQLVAGLRHSFDPGSVLLVHAQFLAAPPFAKVWDSLYADPETPRSECLSKLITETAPKNANYITIDVGLE